MSSNPVERALKAELEKLRHELAPEADAIRRLLADSDKAEETKLAADLKIGERLAHARERLRDEKRGFWLPWLKAEFPLLSVATARRLMSLYELSKCFNLQHLQIPKSALYLITAEGTPSAARDEIMRRAEGGEAFSFDNIATMIAKAKQFLLVQTVKETTRISVPFYTSEPEATGTDDPQVEPITMARQISDWRSNVVPFFLDHEPTTTPPPAKPSLSGLACAQKNLQRKC
jgi:hypothetical protein